MIETASEKRKKKQPYAMYENQKYESLPNK